jgi:hypothetical protein
MACQVFYSSAGRINHHVEQGPGAGEGVLVVTRRLGYE